MAGSFRFLHASDFHLDQPPGGLTELPDQLLEPLIEATYESVDRVFDAAIQERVDFVVLAGDIIHFPTASPRAVDFLAAQFARLSEKKIPVYWLGGQLEAGHALPAEFKLPKSVHRFSASRVQTFEVKKNRKTIAYLVGQASGGHAYANLEDLRVPRDGRFFVGCWYQDGRESLDNDLLDELGIDYWAFGGGHQRSSLTNMIPGEFCGTPQARLPSEHGPHGCLLLTVTGDDIDDTQFLETDSIRYATERIELVGAADREKLQTQVKQRMAGLQTSIGANQHLLVSWEVIHDGQLGAELRRIDQAEAFLDQLRRSGASVAGNVHSIALRSLRATVPSNLFDEDSILGDFLRVVRDLEQSGDRSLDVTSYLPDTPMAKKLAETLHLSSPLARKELLREVTTLGIDLLSGEQA